MNKRYFTLVMGLTVVIYMSGFYFMIQSMNEKITTIYQRLNNSIGNNIDTVKNYSLDILRNQSYFKEKVTVGNYTGNGTEPNQLNITFGTVIQNPNGTLSNKHYGIETVMKNFTINYTH